MNQDEKFADAFKEEAQELLAKMEEVILLLENDPQNKEQINNLFRTMHTIKGSGAMFGFQQIADFTHHLETALDSVRNGELLLCSEFINLLLRSRDLIQEMLFSTKEDGSKTPEIKQILNELENLEAKQPSPIQTSKNFKETTPAETIPPAQSVYRLRIVFNPEMMTTGLDPLCLLEELHSMGECVLSVQTDRVPFFEELDPEFCYFYWDAIINTTASLADIENIFLFVQDESQISITRLADENTEEDTNHKRLGEILIERGDVTGEQIQKVLKKQKRSGELMVEEGLVSEDKITSALAEQKMIRRMKRGASQPNTIRVSIEKLDRLINLVGEMVITQAQLSQVSTRFQDTDLLTPIENVERLTTELRDCALNIRMLPIETTFVKFQRLVRDLSAGLGKDINLITQGGETELDKTVIERIHDPLVHLIRNSIDHGIELPEDRQRAGKSSKGTICLTAGQAGGEVIITIEDDGAGLDRERIRAKGIERNLISESDNLSDSQIYNLIFQAGFSTAKKITDVSGRGVGMDVVKREISKLRGSVSIESTQKGTKISIHLPLTLAIIEGLLIAVGSMYYVVPLTFVQECVELTTQDIDHSHGRHIIQVRGEIIPYIRLREIFNISDQGQRPSVEYIVITSIEGKRIGLVADTIIGNHQAVIKSLGKVYERTEGVSGATILGNGAIALILDTRQLKDCAMRQEIEMVAKG